MESNNVFSVLLSDPAFVVMAVIMIGSFVLGMRVVERWLHDDNFVASLGAILMTQAAFYFYSILPYSEVDDQLLALLDRWLASGLAG